MAHAYDCDVVIVGGGPVGITLGLLLAAEGVSAVIAEREMGIHPLPRAAHIDHEIMRIFQAVAIADEVMATSRAAARYDFLTADRQVLLRFDLEGVRGPSGWPPSNMIHQPSIEAALRRKLGDHDRVVLREGWTFTHCRTDGDGVNVAFDTPDGAQTLRARYLVGCDGASSAVREMSGLKLEDLQFDEPWLVIDTIVHDASRLPLINLQICDPERPTTCVLMGAGRHRWEFMLRPGETAGQVMEEAFVDRLLAPWNVAGAVSIERKAVYAFHALVADRWRAGRVLLAGDAAHQMPPFAGQGLCSGLRDAANLAWKLGAVVRGDARDHLLDTYQVERDPHVRAIIALALMMGRTVCITDPVAAAARDKAMLAQRAAGEGPGGVVTYPPLSQGCIVAGAPGAGEYFPQPWAPGVEHVGATQVGATQAGPALRLDDLLGAGAWLIGDVSAAESDSPGAAPLSRVALSDPALSSVAPDIRRWLEGRGARAVLVRPDRYVFATGEAGDLVAQWRAQCADS